MACPYSVTIGIVTGGVFSDAVDLEALRKDILLFAETVKGDPDDRYHINDKRLEWCLSKELNGPKGGMVVIAGVFNYWGWESVAEFASALSKSLGKEVMAMVHCHASDKVNSGIFLDGKPMPDVNENPIGRIMRRTT